MASSSRSATVVELRRMFPNLDSNVIESVLSANNGKVDVAIDHLLTMSIDAENQNHMQQTMPTVSLRQLPVVQNLYDDDPPPYPGHLSSTHNRATPMPPLPQRLSSHGQTSTNRDQSNNAHFTESTNAQQDLQVRKWKTIDGQYRNCYIGDLPNDFLQVKLSTKSNINNQSNASSGNNNSSGYLDDDRLAILFQNEEFLNELRHNKDFIMALHSDQPVRTPSSTQQRRSSHNLSTKPMPLPTPPTVEVPKTPKVRARMLQNVLTQIEQGQAMKTSMVPEESITQNEEYSYGKERIPLPPAPFVSEYDPLRPETNEEFIARLKNMGKNSMEKFNQLARRFSMRKDTTSNSIKYSRQPITPNPSERQRLANEFDDDDPISINTNNSNRYLASV